MCRHLLFSCARNFREKTSLSSLVSLKRAPSPAVCVGEEDESTWSNTCGAESWTAYGGKIPLVKTDVHSTFRLYLDPGMSSPRDPHMGTSDGSQTGGTQIDFADPESKTSYAGYSEPSIVDAGYSEPSIVDDLGSETGICSGDIFETATTGASELDAEAATAGASELDAESETTDPRGLDSCHTQKRHWCDSPKTKPNSVFLPKAALRSSINDNELVIISCNLKYQGSGVPECVKQIVRRRIFELYPHSIVAFQKLPQVPTTFLQKLNLEGYEAPRNRKVHDTQESIVAVDCGSDCDVEEQVLEGDLLKLLQELTDNHWDDIVQRLHGVKVSYCSERVLFCWSWHGPNHKQNAPLYMEQVCKFVMAVSEKHNICGVIGGDFNCDVREFPDTLRGLRLCCPEPARRIEGEYVPIDAILSYNPPGCYASIFPSPCAYSGVPIPVLPLRTTAMTYIDDRDGRQKSENEVPCNDAVWSSTDRLDASMLEHHTKLQDHLDLRGGGADEVACQRLEELGISAEKVDPAYSSSYNHNKKVMDHGPILVRFIWKH